jgi:hypothetical protein
MSINLWRNRIQGFWKVADMMNFDIDREVETAEDAGEQHLAGTLTREVETWEEPVCDFLAGGSKGSPTPSQVPVRILESGIRPSPRSRL